MQRTHLPAMLAIGLGITALMVVFVFQPRETAAAREVEGRLASLEATVQSVTDALARLEASEVRAREARFAAPHREQIAGADIPTAGPPRPDASAADEAEHLATAPDDRATQEEFEELWAGILAAGVSVDHSSAEYGRLLELARSSPHLGEVIEELEALVTEDPTNVAARLDLAEAYVAKLLTVPVGPERGLWGVKAEEQWQGTLVTDDRNWEAQYKLGDNLSYYPDHLGRTQESIDALERALELQSSLPTTDDHVQTYLSLNRVYARTQQTDRARETLEQGLTRHPDDPDLLAALAALGGEGDADDD